MCFRQRNFGLKDAACPCYICEEYNAANRQTRRVRRSPNKVDPKQTDADAEQDVEVGTGIPTETEPSSGDEAKMEHIDPDADGRILKMLYKGNIEEANRKEAQTRKSHCVSHKHNVYRHTRCTSVAQEEQSALPAGVNIRLFIIPSPFRPRHGLDWNHFSMMFGLCKKSIFAIIR